MLRAQVAGVRLRNAAGVMALAAIVAVAFLLDLGRPNLWDPGEGRYAETVREMLLTGNWLVPTLNFAHYYDKPPGFFWMVAVCFRAFGATEWAARLPAAIAAALTIAATVVFAWRRTGVATALCAGAVLATAGQFVVLGRSVRMDMLLALTVAGTLFYAYRLWTDDAVTHPQRTSPTWPIYLLSAIGLLVKGPIAIILPVLVIATFTAVTGEWKRLRHLRPGWGLAVAAGFASSWYVIAAVRAPDYLWSFLWRQNVDRFLEGANGAGHAEPLWFYFWVLPLTFLPWTLFLPGAIRRSVQRARRGHDLDVFLLTWVAVVFVFFTLSRAKLATYLLPLFPPLALMVAAYLRGVLDAPAAVRVRALKVPTFVWMGALAIAAAGIAIAVGVRYPRFAWQAASASALLIFPLAGLLLVRRGRWETIPVLVVVATLVAQVLFYRSGAAVMSEFNSLHAAAVVARALPADARVVAYKTRGHSFTFYAERPLTRLRSPEAAAAALAGDEPVGLLTKAKYLDRIQAHLTEPVCVWWQGASGRIFLANRPYPDTTRHAALVPWSTTAQRIVDDSPRC